MDDEELIDEMDSKLGKSLGAFLREDAELAKSAQGHNWLPKVGRFIQILSALDQDRLDSIRSLQAFYDLCTEIITPSTKELLSSSQLMLAWMQWGGGLGI